MSVIASTSSNLTLIIDEYSGRSHNQVIEAAEVYLSTKLGPSNDRLQVSKTSQHMNIKLAMEKDEEVEDTFEDIKLNWRFCCVTGVSSGVQKHHFELTFDKQHIAIVSESYFPYVLQQAKAIKEREYIAKLYACNGGNGRISNYGFDDMELGSVEESSPSRTRRS